MKICPYQAYYNNQAGTGIGTVVYKGAPYQRGHGIGSFFSGLFRTILPILKKGASSVGKEALKTGINVLGDLSENRPVKESFRNRISEAGKNLKRKAETKIDSLISGAGYKKKRKVKTSQSRRVTKRAKNKTKKIKDIFN